MQSFYDATEYFHHLLYSLYQKTPALRSFRIPPVNLRLFLFERLCIQPLAPAVLLCDTYEQRTGRKRWKIENEGFNRQKNWQGDITHACSHNANAMKNHYLMAQIADMVKQLYEWFFLKRHGIIKRQKNISSELLASFDRQLTTEDISITEDINVVQLV